MNNYEDKSDFELNKAVAEALGNKHRWEEGVYDINRGPSIKACLCCLDAQPLPNYCNNPSDAWPIITENMISIRFDATHNKAWAEKNYGIGYTVSVPHVYRHKNTLRAAMIVFLKMQEAP